jgi:5-hydroxytryptamine receptor 1
MNQSAGNLTSLVASLDIPIKPGRMTFNAQSFRIVVIVISTLINFFVALVIRFSRQLHYPRHLYWVAISVVNQFCLIQAVVQIVFYLSRNNRVACQIYVFNAGEFYTIILSFVALAALDPP